MQQDITVIVDRHEHTDVQVWVGGVRLRDEQANVFVIDPGHGWTRAGWIADRAELARAMEQAGVCVEAREQALALHDQHDDNPDYIDDDDEHVG